MIDFSLVFAAGFLGSAHCVGMCGGFVLAASTAPGRGARLTRQLMYFTGKTLTYTIMGAAVGFAGSTVGSAFSGVQNVISIGAGAVMLVLGLHLLGVLGRLKGMGTLMNWPPFRVASRYLMQQRSVVGALGLGLLNGLLPCGLVYSLLAMAAATGTILGGALTMFVFGCATVPALLVLAWIGHLGARPAWQHRLHRASGVLVVVLGVITVLRGTPAMHLLMS
jgi:sulfite exporter TauE/SafE